MLIGGEKTPLRKPSRLGNFDTVQRRSFARLRGTGPGTEPVTLAELHAVLVAAVEAVVGLSRRHSDSASQSHRKYNPFEHDNLQRFRVGPPQPWRNTAIGVNIAICHLRW